MPFRRPGTAASTVAAMAGDHGSRSSRPRLGKPRNEKQAARGERGEDDEAHQGGNGDGGGSEEAVRAEGRSAEVGDLGAAVVAPTRAGERKMGRRGSRERRRRLGADLKRPGREGGHAPTMPFVGGGCGQAGWFRGAQGEDGTDKRARASAAGHGAQARRLPGAACWAGAAAGPSGWAGGAGLSGEKGRGG
ncbi:uncharacterized protein [Miscanthus floridulus]|uniref:uncharacterized protein n=1 Tax=Miscanthus floridulus TaxID=154761 RepID=UPI003459F2CA